MYSDIYLGKTNSNFGFGLNFGSRICEQLILSSVLKTKMLSPED